MILYRYLKSEPTPDTKDPNHIAYSGSNIFPSDLDADHAHSNKSQFFSYVLVPELCFMLRVVKHQKLSWPSQIGYNQQADTVKDSFLSL